MVRDPIEVRRRIAVVPQMVNLDRSLTIRENLVFHARYHGIGSQDAGKVADELLKRFELDTRAGERPLRLSGGQMQRVVIARALMHRPETLFCDEPSRGLDPAARVFVWDRIREARNQGTTVLLTTHDMEEAATFADRVAIMDHGKILVLGTADELVHNSARKSSVTLWTEPGRLTEHNYRDYLTNVVGVAELVSIDGQDGDRDRVQLTVSGDPAKYISHIAAALAEHDLDVFHIEGHRPTLEDVFLELTGKALR